MRASKHIECLFAVALLAATLAAYHPAWFGRPIWDDDAHMTAPQLHSWTGLLRIWTEPGATQQYYPLVHSIFWLEYKIWGYTPWAYHLVNILLHVLCVLLLCKILRLLDIPGAWLAAAIFALHPIEVESVAWISELKNTLSGAFYFGAALCYLRFDRARKRRLYFIALLLFLLGLFCKTVISTMPAALLVVFWWKRGKLSWERDAKPLIPFFILGIAMGLVTAHVEKKFVIGGDIAAFHFTAAQRCLIAGRAFWFYIGKLVWPAKLVFIYQRWDVNPYAWWQYLFPAWALALFATLWLLRHRSRAPLAAALFYGGTLFPALGFVNVYPFVYSFVADHFQYLAGIGIITPAAAGAALLYQRLLGPWKIAAHCLGAAVFLLLAALTWRQCGMYANVRVLYTKTIEQNPGCWLAWNNLGNYLLAKGQVDDAVGHYLKALEIKPDYAKAENNLGEALYEQGKVADAVADFQKAVKLRPDLPDAYNNLGNIERRAGNLTAAMDYYQKALAIQPGNVAALNGLGNVYFEERQFDDALTQYNKALEIQPDLPITLNNIGNTLLSVARVREAISRYEQALHYDPKNLAALNNLAWLLSTADSSVRDGAKAVEFAEKANQLSGGEDLRYLSTLAAAYAENGRFADAVTAAEHALRLATAAHDTAIVNVLTAELAYYRAGKPFHQTSQ